MATRTLCEIERDAIMSRFDLSGETAVVIGATGVLGGRIAVGLAEAGASAAILGRREEAGMERVREIERAGGNAAFVFCDAVNPESVRESRDKTTALLGEPTILVNAAGGNRPEATVTPENPFEAVDTDEWNAVMTLNYCGGIYYPCREYGAAMVRAGRGSIVNIASVAAHIPLSRVAAYSSAKAAVLSLTQFLAREWASKGVRVNSITPGFFPAEQNRRLLYNEDGTPTERAAQILGHTPAGRFGSPDELVGAAIFLASENASSFVTGADIRVDGGFLATTI